MPTQRVIIIGSGVSGLSAACYLAQAGYAVTVLEKNDQTGGRARQFEADGFVFDMGPSWYWMPDVFEKFYNDFGHTTSDFYELKRLDPSYQVYWKEKTGIDIPADMGALENLFEQYEPGSAPKLRQFLKEAAYKYTVGMNDLVYKPSLSLLEFADLRLLNGMLKMDVLTSMKKHIRQFVSHPFLIELLEFPILFLGALPQNTPALYSLMNYADMSLGTWYPMGGMRKIIDAFEKIAVQNGVSIVTNAEVTKIIANKGHVNAVITSTKTYEADIVVGAGDYHHIEQHLLPEKCRQYDESYWNKRKLAPSSLLYYVGLNKKLKNLRHHNLFFDEDFNQHANEIYTDIKWPEKPLFYASVPSITDASVAPTGSENLFLLIPVSTELTDDSEEIRAHYFNMIIERLERLTNQSIKDHIVYKRSYAKREFVSDYHSFKGNAYGLANTLDQTAILKPRIKSKKLNNMYYAGQLTVPGPGLPPSIISGNVVAKMIAKEHALNITHINNIHAEQPA
ncbi:MAG: phytoene desaturase family protein [Bacteroidia bacterium]|jgi:phytoene desaturase|nr:phytoene desaturase family protein [Bacteroidia bacterium]